MKNLTPERGCFYLERWVFTLFGFSIRLHHWLKDDDQRYFHDHPFHMLIIILKGSYTDISPIEYKTGAQKGQMYGKSLDFLRAGSVRFRKATHKHSVVIDNDGCWSLLFTSPIVRHWGFWIPGRDRLLRPLRYFERYGHHQCEK